jgi:hypothetical protein
MTPNRTPIMTSTPRCGTGVEGVEKHPVPHLHTTPYRGCGVWCGVFWLVDAGCGRP